MSFDKSPKGKETETSIAINSEPEPLVTPPTPEWGSYQLRGVNVYKAQINGKACRVNDMEGGYKLIEVDGIDAVSSEEPADVCMRIAEKSAHEGRMLRRFLDIEGKETYR